LSVSFAFAPGLTVARAAAIVAVFFAPGSLAFSVSDTAQLDAARAGQVASTATAPRL
jgi:hypothetical protein